MLRAGGEVGVAAETVDLRPAGHAGADDVPGLIVRDGMGEVVDVVGAFGARANKAHIPAHDVPILRKLVEVPAAHERADAEEAGIVAGSALLGGVGRSGVRSHAAEFVEGERTVVGADTSLSEEDGAAGRLAFDEGGEQGDNGCGADEADDGAKQIEGAFEAAVEKAVDGELLDAEDGNAADRLEAEAAEENIEGAGDDLPLNVGAFAGFDDALDIGAREV